MEPRRRRVLLKVSGEALGGKAHAGLDPEALATVAAAIGRGRSAGAEIAVVLGAGNFLRGAALERAGFVRETSDLMGMAATVINALALEDRLRAAGVPARALSAIPFGAAVPAFERRRALEEMEQGRVVVLAGGTGNPHFTTDTAAALRALELGAELLLKATRVDGVYDADPEKVPGARRFDRLTATEALQRRLAVMDATAITLCLENRLPAVVFNLHVPGNIEKAVAGEPVGTRIEPV
ncbi:MAG: UMP kinase [Planctomycetes bacterium]|jgi:uridylate kinase|nr:UMP kinase [Planctomycetota bacterium]